MKFNKKLTPATVVVRDKKSLEKVQKVISHFYGGLGDVHDISRTGFPFVIYVGTGAYHWNVNRTRGDNLGFDSYNSSKYKLKVEVEEFLEMNTENVTDVDSELSEGVLSEVEYEYTLIKFDTLLEAVKEHNNGTTKLYYKDSGSGEYYSVEDDYTLAWVWVNKNQRFYTQDEVVNLSATPLNIPWEFIEEKFKFAAMDKDGEVYLFTLEPSAKVDQNEWRTDRPEDDCVSLPIKTDYVSWKTSLTKRPTEK